MSNLKQLSEHFKNNCSFLEQKYIVDFINDQRKNSNNNKIKIALDLFYSLNEIDKNNFINNDIENFKIDSKSISCKKSVDYSGLSKADLSEKSVLPE